ncbi:RusA family crossover junction endodeoxyribonuclease [Rhodococcus sp. IEGM1300]
MGELLCSFDMPLMMFGKYQRSVSQGYTIDESGKKKRNKPKKVFDEMVRGRDKGLFPTVNHIYRPMRGGKQLTEMAKDQLVIWNTIADIEWGGAGYEVPIDKELVYIDAYFILPDKKIRDVSNVLKLLMDALEGVVYKNDYYALPRIMDMRVIEGDARCYLEVRKGGTDGGWLDKVTYGHE